MIQKVFSVYDCKAEAYLQPFFMMSKGEAVRGFSDLANDSSTSFYKHPEDYTLFEIGEYCTASGVLVPLDAHISIGKAIEYKN
jgi:hypothetical protein